MDGAEGPPATGTPVMAGTGGTGTDAGFESAGEVMVVPQWGQGPDTPARCIGTVSVAWQALHWK